VVDWLRVYQACRTLPTLSRSGSEEQVGEKKLRRAVTYQKRCGALFCCSHPAPIVSRTSKFVEADLACHVMISCANSIHSTERVRFLGRSFLVRSDSSPQYASCTTSSQLSCNLTMTTETQGQNDTLSSLNTAIDALNLAKESTGVIPARSAFTSASVLLTMVKVGSLPVSVGRLLANVRRAL